MTPAEPEGRESYLPKSKRHGMALCLSGGGYRAALFHLGVLRRLNELGTLGRLETISAVSGGSILAAFLAQRVRPWPAPGERIEHFDDELVDEFRAFTRKNIRTLWVLRRALPWRWLDSTVAVRSLERRYAKDIVQLLLADLPGEAERPCFIFSATDMSFGVNWVSQRSRVGSYQAGYVTPGAGLAGGAGGGRLLVLPARLRADADRARPGAPDRWPRAGRGPARRARAGLTLTDGGVYDNMGLEPVWKGHAVVLVSDGGATFDRKAEGRLLKRVGRYLSIQAAQAGAVRKRWLIASFKKEVMHGVYLGIGSAASHFEAGAAGLSGLGEARRGPGCAGRESEAADPRSLAVVGAAARAGVAAHGPI